ncbi:MAG TPA: hypothetical protein VL357_05955 [Rariglobus sp.]|jgi:hypothetical protein|nr:hypothetical protein [Rariglobus sp.]
MKPIDFRNATYADLQERLTGLRQAVFDAWLRYGPCSTEHLAEVSGISILTLRPRTTELVQLGFVRLADRQPEKGTGTYRAANSDEVLAHLRTAKQDAVTGQMTLC